MSVPQSPPTHLLVRNPAVPYGALGKWLPDYACGLPTSTPNSEAWWASLRYYVTCARCLAGPEKP